MAGLTLDAGALIAADKNDRRFWAFWKERVRRRVPVVVPAAVVAQVWRGPENARMAAVLNGCRIEPLSEAGARAVGELCGRSSSSDVIDANVVLSSSVRADDVLTSDPGDLERIASHVHPAPRILDLKRLPGP